MNQQLVRHGSIYTLARVASYAGLYALLPVYAHLIGDAGFGLLELLATVSALLGLVFMQGLGGAWLRLRFDQAADSLRCFEASIIWYLAASIAVGVGLLTLLGPRLASVATPGVAYYPFGLLAVAIAALSVMPRLYETKLQADQRPGAFALFTLSRAGLTAGLIALFVAGLSRDAQGKLEAEALACAGFTCLSLVLLRPSSIGSVSRTSLKKSIAYGLPLVPHNIAVLVNNMIDRLLLNGLLGLGPTGVYSMGAQVGYVSAVLAIAFNQAYAPIFIKTIKASEHARKAGDEVEASRLVRTLADASLVSLTTVCCAALVSVAFSREVIELITPATFDDSWTVVAPVAAGSIAWACYFPFSQSILYSARTVRLLPIVTIAAAALNVGGNLLLIPRVGIAGAAWATLISNAVMAVLALWIGQRATPVPYRWGRWLALLCWTGAGLALFHLLDGLDQSGLTRFTIKLGATPVAVGAAFPIAGVGWRSVLSPLGRRG